MRPYAVLALTRVGSRVYAYTGSRRARRARALAIALEPIYGSYIDFLDRKALIRSEGTVRDPSVSYEHRRQHAEVSLALCAWLRGGSEVGSRRWRFWDRFHARWAQLWGESRS